MSVNSDNDVEKRQEIVNNDLAIDDKPAIEEKPTPIVASSFPDGGTTAWLVVVGAWCTSFASFGIVNSYGVYETYYLQSYLAGYSPSTVAWIGSIQTFAQFSATIISGPVTDRYGAQVLIWPASLLLVLAMMLTSLCREYYQFLLCQGILLGFSAGFLYTPALTVIGHYFFKKRAMAMSFASTGSPLGGIIYPVILNNLIPSIGFGWAQRVCGFVTLALLGVGIVFVRPTGMRRQTSFILLDAFKKPTYSLLVAATFTSMLGILIPYFYLAGYGIEHGMSTNLANYLFALINAGSLIGRIVGGLIAQHLGQFNIITVSAVMSSILVFCWLATTSSGGLIVLTVFIGAATGLIIALMMSTFAHTADHPSKIGTYIGQAVFLSGFATLAGPPIAGALINEYHEYTQAIIFTGVVNMAAAVLFGCARYSFAKDKLVSQRGHAKTAQQIQLPVEQVEVHVS